jgi:hypothetical protein
MLRPTYNWEKNLRYREAGSTTGKRICDIERQVEEGDRKEPSACLDVFAKRKSREKVTN